MAKKNGELFSTIILKLYDELSVESKIRILPPLLRCISKSYSITETLVILKTVINSLGLSLDDYIGDGELKNARRLIEELSTHIGKDEEERLLYQLSLAQALTPLSIKYGNCEALRALSEILDRLEGIVSNKRLLSEDPELTSIILNGVKDEVLAELACF